MSWLLRLVGLLLMLTALCVALPARAGLTVIGGEGALVLGGFSSAAITSPPASCTPRMRPSDTSRRWTSVPHRSRTPSSCNMRRLGKPVSAS